MTNLAGPSPIGRQLATSQRRKCSSIHSDLTRKRPYSLLVMQSNPFHGSWSNINITCLHYSLWALPTRQSNPAGILLLNSISRSHDEEDKRFKPTSPVEDHVHPQPPKQQPQRPPSPQSRNYQDITLGLSASSNLPSSSSYHKHILNPRHEEKKDSLLQKRSNNINYEFNSTLATAASKEELNSPDSALLQITASKAPRTQSPTAQSRRKELVGT